MSGRKEAAELARQYERAGYTVGHGGNGHLRATDADGNLVTTFAATPGSARSSWADRLRMRQVLAGKPILGRMGTTGHEVPEQTVAAEAVPKATRNIPSRDYKTERAQRVIELPRADVAQPRATGDWTGQRIDKSTDN
jgi:hypothetical protein